MAIQTIVLSIILLILVPAYVVYKPPKCVISVFQYRFPEVLFQTRTSKKIVALTIDDAPSAYTQRILTILKQNNASATFFVIGDQLDDSEEQEDTLRSILKAGSELGNHAMHDEPSITLPDAVLEQQIHHVDKEIDRIYAAAREDRIARLFRPGSGIFSRRILNIASKANYRTILGSIYPHDPFITFWRVNAWHILSMVRPGAIIICHDRRSWTLPMLQKVLPKLKAKGWEVVSVSRMIEMTSATP